MSNIEKTGDSNANHESTLTENCNAGKSSKCEQCSINSFQRLTESFETSARRWEMVVYPSLLAFVVLAAYGFYLVYSLTHDVHEVRANMDAITSDMHVVAGNMNQVATNMEVVAKQMNMISTNVASQATALNSMVVTVYDMNKSMKGMTVSVDQIRLQMGAMNWNVSKVSRPMNMLNTFMPW